MFLGSIVLHDYENNEDHEWIVESGCEQVRIQSTHFDTEGDFDHLTIDGEVYSRVSGVYQLYNIIPIW